MREHVRYYESQAILEKEHLHPVRRVATERLISRIQPARIPHLAVEIGCGLGRTTTASFRDRLVAGKYRNVWESMENRIFVAQTEHHIEGES